MLDVQSYQNTYQGNQVSRFPTIFSIESLVFFIIIILKTES